MKRDGLGVQTNLPLHGEVVTLAQKAVIGEPEPAYRACKYGYADWVILAIQGLKEYLGHHYLKLMDVLREMPRVTNVLGLTAKTLPHFSTVCTKKQAIPMRPWLVIFDRT